MKKKSIKKTTPAPCWQYEVQELKYRLDELDKACQDRVSKLELLAQPIDPAKPSNLFIRMAALEKQMESVAACQVDFTSEYYNRLTKLETEGKEHLKGILYRLEQLEKEQKHEHDTRREGQCILGQRIEDNYKRLGELEKSVNNPNSALNTWVDAIRKRLERLESVIAVPKAEPPKPKLTKWYAFCTEKQKFEYIGEYEKLYQASDVAAAKYPDALVTVSHDELLSYGKSINELLSPTEESKPLTLNTVESGKTFKFKETFLFGSNIYTIRTGELFYWDESWKAWKFSILSRPPNGSAPVILYPDPSKK